MKQLNKTLLAIALTLTASEAFAYDQRSEMATVVDVQPIFSNVVKYEQVPVIKSVCNNTRRDSQGLIERGVNGGFGSQEGLLGTVIGYGIGNEIGGGSGNDIAKVLGAVVGNKIGNNRAATKSSRCEMVETYEEQAFWAKDVTSYTVSVDVGGSIYTVNRRAEPAIGSAIRVNVSVQ